MAENKIRKLTPRQQEIYDFLKDKIINRGYGPTVREIGAQFGIRSPNGVMCHLKALEKKGLIIRESHMSRAIQLADWPGRRWGLRLVGDVSSRGTVPASSSDERVDFSDLLSNEEYECCRVVDDSLADAQIAAGDYLVVRRQDSYSTGSCVVACSGGQGVVAGRYRREGERARIEPLHSGAPTYADHADLLGVLVGVVRRS